MHSFYFIGTPVHRRPDYPSIRTAPIPILLVVLTMILCPLTGLAERSPADQAHCDIHQHACTRPLSGGSGSVTLDIDPKPVKAMTDLSFRLKITGAAPAAAPHIDLGMPGMNMGPNRVLMMPVTDGGNTGTYTGTYTGMGVIVRCPSGRTLWEAIVHVPGAGTATFAFHAVY